MKHSEEYCHCNKQVLLEECIPSLRNNIWCYPTSRVFSIFLCSCYGEWFMVYSWSYWSIFSDLVYVLKNWYQITFLGQRREELFLFFLQNVSRKEKEGTLGLDMKLYELNLETKIGSLNSSQKITQFQKTISWNGVREVNLWSF